MNQLIGLLITDLHLKEENKETFTSIIKQTCARAIELKLNTILCAGDVFDSRKAQTESNLTTFKESLDYLDSQGITMICIPGNHDKTNYKSSNSFLNAFEDHPAMILLKEPTTLLLKNAIQLDMVPFYDDEVYIEKLQSLKRIYPTRFLITHIGVNGAVMNNGISVESKVASELFDEWDHVFIGHYHNASRYNEKIVYVGSSIQHNFGETVNKGLVLIDKDGNIAIEELNFPRYIKYEVDVTQVTLKDIEDIQKEKAQSGDNIRISLKGSEKDLKAFNIQRLKEAGVSVELKQDLVQEEDLVQRVEAFTDSTILSAFKMFCKKNKLDHNVGSRFLKKVINV